MNSKCRHASSNLSRTSHISFYLGPSRLHGVRVFAAREIPSGTALRLFSPSEVAVLRRPAKINRAFVERYGVREGQRFWTAPDFGRMSVGWYLNHSDRPNARRLDYRYYACRDIPPNKEITIDYMTL